MEELLEWQKQIRKNNKRKWNEPKVFRRDVSAIRYATSKGCDFIYVDMETGEVMQFGYLKSKGRHTANWDGMFPSRKMKAMPLEEYSKITMGKEAIL